MKDFNKKIKIGLEVHVSLKTKEKIFCNEQTNSLSQPQNPFTLGLPGSLPVLNMKTVEYCIKAGYAFNCKINKSIIFDRKNYFYHDLPKNYQITQKQKPLCYDGFIKINNKKIRIKQIHIEEDSAKTINSNTRTVDFKRAGNALIEIVTEPDLQKTDDVRVFLEEVRRIVRFIDISDGNMENADIRADINIGIGDVYVEIKNLNSIKNAEKAIEYEITRIKNGEKINKDTRFFDEKKGVTYKTRAKQDAQTYMYITEPDIPLINLQASYIADIIKSIDFLPEHVRIFCNEHNINKEFCHILLENKNLTKIIFENNFHKADINTIVKWIVGYIYPIINKSENAYILLQELAKTIPDLITECEDLEIDNNIIKNKIIPDLIKNKKIDIKKYQNFKKNDLTYIIEELIKKYPNEHSRYKSGKKGLIGFFMQKLITEYPDINKKKASEKLKVLLERF